MCILGPNLVISCCSWWEGHQFLLQQWEGTGRGRCNFRWSSGFWMGLFRVRKSSVREEQEIFAWMCCFNCTFQTCTVNMTDCFEECVMVGIESETFFSHLFVLTWLLGELIEGCAKEEQKIHAAKDKIIHWIRENGLKHSWKCISWLPTCILSIKSAKPKNYSPVSGFVCVTCTFPDF